MNEINSSWRSRTQKSDWIQGFHYREIEQVQFQELEETKPVKTNFNSWSKFIWESDSNLETQYLKELKLATLVLQIIEKEK